MKKVITYTILSLVMITLSTCKKYPDNTLWFKNPEKLYPFQDPLTKYNVNGIDSIDLLNNYYGNYFGIQKNIRHGEFLTSVEKGAIFCRFNFDSGAESLMGYEFTQKKKFIKVFFQVDTAVFRKNIFIDKELEWKIIRLARKGTFKIETTLTNGNKYEIEIGS